jgi:uncharacterized membrane protein
MMEPLVLWAGHFGIGLAYYLRFFILKTKVEHKKEIDKAYETMSHSQVEMGKEMMKNKWLVLVLYLLVGYFNLFFHAKRIYKNLKEKGNE